MGEYEDTDEEDDAEDSDSAKAPDTRPMTPSGKPYDPKTWEPEDGDPFAGNSYDKAQRAAGDAIGDMTDRRSRPLIDGPLGFALDLVWRFFFPRR